MSTAELEPLSLIDHHVHGVVTADLDRAAFENLISEASGPPAPGTSSFDSQLGFTIRRMVCPRARPGAVHPGGGLSAPPR